MVCCITEAVAVWFGHCEVCLCISGWWVCWWIPAGLFSLSAVWSGNAGQTEIEINGCVERDGHLSSQHGAFEGPQQGQGSAAHLSLLVTESSSHRDTSSPLSRLIGTFGPINSKTCTAIVSCTSITCTYMRKWYIPSSPVSPPTPDWTKLRLDSTEQLEQSIGIALAKRQIELKVVNAKDLDALARLRCPLIIWRNSFIARRVSLVLENNKCLCS